MDSEVWAEIQDKDSTSSTRRPPIMALKNLSWRTQGLNRPRRVSRGPFHMGRFMGPFPSLTQRRGEEWLSPRATPTHGWQKCPRGTAPLPQVQLFQWVAAIGMSCPVSLHLSTSHSPGQSWHLSGSQFPHRKSGAHMRLAPGSSRWNDKRAWGRLTVLPPRLLCFRHFMFWAATFSFHLMKGLSLNGWDSPGTSDEGLPMST